MKKALCVVLLGVVILCAGCNAALPASSVSTQSQTESSFVAVSAISSQTDGPTKRQLAYAASGFNTRSVGVGIFCADPENEQKSYYEDYCVNTSSIKACYDGLVSGEYDVAFVPYVADFVVQAKADGCELESVEIGVDAVIFAVNSGKPADFTKEQIIDVFFGGEKGDMLPIGGNERDAAEFACLLKPDAEGFDESVRLLDGEHGSAAAYPLDSENQQRIWPEYYILGVRGAAGLNGDVVTVDGVYPTVESILDGSYPFAAVYSAVYRAGDTQAQELAQFLAGEQGQSQILGNALIANFKGESDEK